MDPLPATLETAVPEMESPGLTPSNWVNFMTPEMAFEDLEELETRGELHPQHVNILKGMINLSQGYYGLARRRDEFRSTLIGHILPGVGFIVKNKERVLDYYRMRAIVKGEYTSDSEIQSQEYLFRTLALFIAHDWLEDARGEIVDDIPRQLAHLFGPEGESNELFASLWLDLNAITKPAKNGNKDQNRDMEYAIQLREASDVVAMVKLIDRSINHFDDYGSIYSERAIRYINETNEYLIPFFKSKGLEHTSLYIGFVASIILLQLDLQASESVYSELEVKAKEEARLEKLYDKRPDAWRHVERMLAVLEGMHKELQIKPTQGFRLAILIHDIVGNTLDGTSPHDRNLYGRFNKLLEKNPKLVSYAIGVARSAHALEQISEELRVDAIDNFTRRDVKGTMGRDGMQNDVSPRQKELLKKVYENEEITKDEFEEIRTLRPVTPPPDKLIRALDQDIEGVVLLAIEKLDNIENPPEYDKFGYTFRAASEILYFIVPLLQVGGMNTLAQTLRGKALEKLSSEENLVEAEKIYDSYNRLYNNFLPELAEDIYSLNIVTADTSITTNRKAMGSIARSIEKGEYEGTMPDDIVRLRVVFPDLSESELLRSTVSVLRELIANAVSQKYINQGVRALTIEHPDPNKRNNSVKFMGGFEDIGEHEISGLMDGIVSDDQLSVRPNKNNYRSINVKCKIEMADGTVKYIEVQLAKADWHFENSLGKAAHVLYKQGVQEPSIEDVHALKEIYIRHLIYWLLPNAYVLSEESVREIREHLDYIEGVSSVNYLEASTLTERILNLIGDPEKIHRFVS